MLTVEQSGVIDAIRSGIDVRVKAYAGTGKTFTLVKAAKAARRRGLYVAFNKAIATDASLKFGATCACRTAHSIAYRHALNAGFDPQRLTAVVNGRTLPCGRRDAPIVSATLRHFCQSSDDRVLEQHIPRTMREVANRGTIVRQVSAIWEEMCDLKSTLPIGHDGYLKIWALDNPRLDSSYDYILLDEAQDLNPVIIGVIANQLCQVVSVGDPYQQIYAWRGAVDALEVLPGRELRLTQSFRFGEQIADTATRLLNAMGEPVPCYGNPDIADDVGNPLFEYDTILCRTNIGLINLLCENLSRGRRVHVIGGIQSLKALVHDVKRLMGGEPATCPELLGFVDWSDVREYARNEDGADLRVLISLVETYGCDRLLSVFDEVQTIVDQGCLVLSTAHKAKGLEWSNVEIHSDFEAECPGLDERRLLYVAATRAQHALGLHSDMLRPYLTNFE
jgi:hypothetical protein